MCVPAASGITVTHSVPILVQHIREWIDHVSPALADLGHEGEPEVFTIPFTKPKGNKLTSDQQSFNTVHGALRSLG